MSTESLQLRPGFTLSTILLLLAVACSPTPRDDWYEKLKDCPSTSELGQIEAWDNLQIRVFEEEGMSGEYEVSPSGTINFPRIGKVEVAGLRCDEVEQLLTEKLSESYLRSPSVVCLNLNVERTAVTVDGEVGNSGVIEYRRGLMLTDVVAQSGGLTPRAVGNSLVLTRKKKSGGSDSVVVPYNDIVTSKQPDVCMYPGDRVFVPEAVF